MRIILIIRLSVKDFPCNAELSNLGGIITENHRDAQAGIAGPIETLVITIVGIKTKIADKLITIPGKGHENIYQLKKFFSVSHFQMTSI